MLCLFPFELEYCANVNKQAFCIGHPLLEKQSAFECNDKENIICIMPGSRRSEIQHNLEVMIDGFNQFNFERYRFNHGFVNTNCQLVKYQDYELAPVLMTTE